jgi:hypothetical protein
MKKLLLITLLVFVTGALFAQTDGMSYQAVIINPNIQEIPGVDVSGNILPDTTVSIRFTIIDSNNLVEYQEMQTTTTDAYGMINLIIGQGESSTGSFLEILWDGKQKNLKVEIKFDGTYTYNDLSNQILLFTPYALHRDIIATGDLVVDGTTTLNSSLTVANATPTILTGKLDVDGTTTLNSSLTVANATPTILTGKLDVDGATDLKNTLNVDGATDLKNTLNVDGATDLKNTLNVDGIATLKNQLIVEGTTDLNSTLTVDGATLIKDDLTVTGTTTLEGLEIKTIDVKSDNTSFVATFENTNAGNGDGIKIKLGKKGIKHNQVLVTADDALGEWVGKIDPSELNKIKGLLDGDLNSSDVEYMFAKAIPDVEEAAEMALQILATACFMGQSVVNLIITEAIDPIIEAIDVAGVICTYDDDGPNDEWDKGEYYCIGDQDFGCKNIGKPFSFPTLNLGNFTDDVLTNENVFIEFTDQEDNHVGAIKGADMDDWMTDYFDKVYLYKLVNSMRGLDKTKIISEIKEVSAEIAKSYYHIGVEYSSGNGDYAEWLERLDPNELIGTGDIVAVKGGKITKDLTSAEQVMAVSHHPIVLGNIPEKGRGYLGNNIAFMGQIPVKMMGPVVAGDYIVGKGDIKGFGVAISPEDMTIEDFKYAVGRSWDTNTESGPKMVNTVVGVHNGDYLNILKRTEDRLKSVEDKVEALHKLMIN